MAAGLQFRVRVAFTTNPMSGSPSWTDISQWVDVQSGSIAITRGTPDQYDSVQPSTLSITLDNHDGRFTAGYSGGAYYPNVLRGRRIHVDATVDGTNYFDRFDGFVDTWPTTFAPTGKYAEANLTAVDLLKKLSNYKVTTDLVNYYMQLTAAPDDHWPLTDADGAAIPVNIGSGAQKTKLKAYTGTSADPGTVVFGSATGLVSDSNTSVEMTNAMFVGTGGAPQMSGAAMCFVKFNTFDSSFGADLININDGTSFVDLYVSTAGLPIAWTSYQGASPTTATCLTPINDGEWHHVAMTWNLIVHSFSVTIWVDGQNVTSATATGVGSPAWHVTNVAQNAPLQFSSTGVMDVAHVAVFSTIPTNIADIANAGLNGFSPETSASRFTRIASFSGITPTTTGQSGTQTMGPLTGINGSTLLDLLQGVEDTENGFFFVQTSGTLQLLPRMSLYNQSVTLAVAKGQYTVDLSFAYDDSLLLNDVTATGTSGNPQEASNAASITADGVYSDSIDLNTTSDAEALSYAGWRVYQATSVLSRCDSVPLDLFANQSMLPGAWSVDIGTTITLAGLPNQAPSSSLTLLVLGYTETYSLGSSQPYMLVANTAASWGNGWVLGDSTNGVLGTTTIMTY